MRGQHPFHSRIQDLRRAADKAELLNESYKKLQRRRPRRRQGHGTKPDVQLGYLRDAQKQWIAYRDSACTFEDSLAFGGTSIGGNSSSCLCALSYERIKFERMEKQVIGSP